MSMIKLSNGVELSEDTVVSALKKAGIETNPPEPKHFFEAGDVAKNQTYSKQWRFIVNYCGKLLSFNKNGRFMSEGQKRFESEDYKFIGKQKDLILED